jgi:plastocyanin
MRQGETPFGCSATTEEAYWQEISRMRYILPFPVLVAALLTSVTAYGAEDLSFELSIKDHKFTPTELTIPAGKQVKLTIKNLDSTPAEFESDDFKAEKVVPGGGEVSLRIGPLKAGTYGFFDEFHEDQTKGTLVVK